MIKHLAFSPDGSRLAVTLHGGEGMRLWETGNWRLLAEDKDYGGKHSYGAAFDRANRLYTVAYDGLIRRYGANGRLEAKAKTKGGNEPFSIAVHPNSAKLAIGYDDTTGADVYDAATLKRLYAADTNGLSGRGLSSVAWAANGEHLYAGKTWWGPFNLFSWSEEGLGKRSETPLSQDTIMQLLPCGGGIAVGASDPAFGLIAPDGSRGVWQESVVADMRIKLREAFTLSASGKRVRFSLGLGGQQPVLFDLAAFRLTDDAQTAAGLEEPRISGLNVGDWENKSPKLNDKPIALEAYEISRSLAIAPDASRFVLGTEYRLRTYRADGGELWQKAGPGVTWGVNISGDGRLVVAAYGDGTIRWHRLSDGQELLALFVHAKDKRFVAWTPKGYYAASPGAEDSIGWQVNRDWDHAPDFYPASRFRDQFNRPDIVKRVLDDLDEDKAIAEANRLAGAKPVEQIAKKLPPVITILSPGEGGAFSSDSLSIRYSLRSPSGLAISELTALVDGRPLAALEPPSGVRDTSDTEVTLPLTGLPRRDLMLSLVARGGGLESTPATIRLKYQSAPQRAPADSAAQSTSIISLYALVVGVGKFKDKSINGLEWAGKDARDFAAALKRQEGRLYRKVDVKLLADEDADNGSILDGLTWLQRQVSQGDVGVLFLAGHGVTDPSGDYYYVPYNARIETVAGLPLPTRGSSVPDTEISHTLKQLAGNALFFFDTCHSGKASGVAFRGLDYNKLINEISGSANAIVLASSTGSESSLESAEWQHGAFTKALLEGIEGKGLHYTPGIVTIDELNLYVKERVKELTEGLQHPVDLKPKEARDIPFAMP